MGKISWTRVILGGLVAGVHVWGFLVGIRSHLALRRDTAALRCWSKDAACAGAAVWCLGYLLAAVTPLALKFFTTRLMVIGLTVGWFRLSPERLRCVALPRRDSLITLTFS